MNRANELLLVAYQAYAPIKEQVAMIKMLAEMEENNEPDESIAVTIAQAICEQRTDDETALLAAYERGRSDMRRWCVAKVKYWFGGDSTDDRGYECVREIENG